MDQQRFPLITSTTGLNNKVNAARARYDRESGIADLTEAVNIDIDDTGGIASRLGQVEADSTPCHSLYSVGGDAFLVQDRVSDSAIMLIGSDLSLSGVRSGLTLAAKVSFCQVGAKTFYVNGTQNGVIESGISSAWPATTYYGPDTLKEFSPAPVGTHLAHHQGRMWIAIDKVIYCSEPFKPGLFRLARCFFHFGTNVRMMRPVAGGVWVSDSEQTGFIGIAENWDGQRYVRKFALPAHEWSDNQRLVDLSRTALQVPGLSAVWSCDAGLMVGTADGQLINVTEQQLDYPTGASGATVIDGFNAINSVY